MDRYPLISDQELIGDLQTAALVTTEGTIVIAFELRRADERLAL